MLLILIVFSQASYAQSKELPESVIIEGNWSDSIEPVYNVGEKAQNFEEILFSEILNLEKIKEMQGYKSPADTRIVLSAYELQHRGVVDFVRRATKLGYKFKIVVDGNLITDFTALTSSEIGSLTPEQKEYYFSTYGTGSQEEINKVQQRYRVTRWCWSQLQEIQKEFPRLVTLISSPGELYPSQRLNYPRIHHWKEYSVQFRVDHKWIAQKSFIPSANLTNTCLNHEKGRISSSYVNFLRYTRAPLEDWDKALKNNKINQASYDSFINASLKDRYKIAFAKTNKNAQTGQKLRSGHIQFGLIFKDSNILNILKGDQSKRWERVYKKGLFFDSSAPRKLHLPEIKFQDPKTGHQSWVRAYFSEGVKKANANSDFVGTTYNSIFNDPGNSIRVFKSTQFVSTHPRVLKKVQAAIALEEFEEFFMVVDGNFSTENYSAFQSLVSSRINDDAGVSQTRSTDYNPLSQDKKRQVMNSMYSFDGHEGIYGGDGVKLHAKMSYIEYVDSHGIRHYVLIEGSGNLSVNAGKGNADGLILIDTTDPALKEKVSPYFEGLKNNQRTKPFLETFLQKRMAHIVKYSDQASIEIKANKMEQPTSPKHIQHNWELINIKDGLLTKQLAQLLNNPVAIKEQKKFLTKIKNSIIKASNNSAFHENFVELLTFFNTLNTPMDFEHIYQMFYLASPHNHPYQGFIKEVSIEWLALLSTKKRRVAAQDKFNQILNKLSRFDLVESDIELTRLGRAITLDCADLYRRRGLEKDFERFKKRIK